MVSCEHGGRRVVRRKGPYDPRAVEVIADSGAIRGVSFPGIDYRLPHHIRVFDVAETSLTNGRVFAEIEPGVPDGFRVVRRVRLDLGAGRDPLSDARRPLSSSRVASYNQNNIRELGTILRTDQIEGWYG